MKISDKIKSKRLFAYLLSIIIFIVLAFATDYELTSIASSLTMLTGIYVVAESARPSKPN